MCSPRRVSAPASGSTSSRVTRRLPLPRCAADLLAELAGVLKVDTIGDAYYAVCGHTPEQADTHAATMLSFAEELLNVRKPRRAHHVCARFASVCVDSHHGVHVCPVLVTCSVTRSRERERWRRGARRRARS